MEDKDPKVSFDVKQFLVMWGQEAGLFALSALIVLGLVCLFVGIVTLLQVAGLLVGSILCFVISTLGLTIWGWIRGDRP